MPRLLSTIALALILSLLSASLLPAIGYAQETPAAGDDDEDVGSLRARPSPRPYDNPNAQPGDEVRGSRALETTEDAGPPRLDDPVLQWLPEITDASTETGTPISLIAGIMRVESNGDPTITSPQGAQGLMQIMPAEMRAQDIPREKWLDPPTNVMAGAVILAQRSGAGWEAAAAYYFGIGCDYYGTCTYGYAVAVIGWANAYASLLGDPHWYDVGRIPDVPSSPEPDEEPTEEPTPTPTATATATTEPTPADEPGTPVSDPTEELTEEPTAEPTAEPTEEPTAVPTEVPTEEPTPESEPTEEVAEPTTEDAAVEEAGSPTT